MFNIVRGELPVSALEVEQAVRKFSLETELKGDRAGFIAQTLQSIHAAVFQHSGDFWALMDDGELVGYAMGRVVCDVDNKLTYWLSQAWLDPSLRNTGIAKKCFKLLEKQALSYFCRHIVVVSSRKSRPYCRFLGQGWHEYVSLLKKDI